MITILLFLAVLSFLILIHEGGHLVAAKLSDIWVHQFSIGFGPELVSFKINETTYSLKPILFGGYVKMAGEDVGGEEEVDEEVPEERKFYSKPPLKKMAVSLSGPAMNLIAAVLIMIVLVGASGVPYIAVYDLMEGSPSKGVLKRGDIILSIAGRRVNSTGDINAVVQKNKNQSLNLRIKRNGEVKEANLTPQLFPEEGRYLLGVSLGPATTAELTQVSPDSPLGKAGAKKGDVIVRIEGEATEGGIEVVEKMRKVIDEGEKANSVAFTVRRGDERIELKTPPVEGSKLLSGVSLRTPRRNVGPVTSVKLGLSQIRTILVLTYQGIRMIIGGEISAGKAVSGPVGIANMLGESAKQGAYSLFTFIALISLNLGLVNLIPFPALDGSRVGFALYELIRGKPVPPEKEGLIHSIGFFILIGLLIFITYQDIVKLFG